MSNQANHVDLLAGVLSGAAATGYTSVEADFLVTPEKGATLHAWSMLGSPTASPRTAAGIPRSAGQYEVSAKQCAQQLFSLLNAGSKDPKIYNAQFEFSGRVWRKKELKQLARVEPVATGTSWTLSNTPSPQQSEVAVIIGEDANPVAEVKAARQLVLSNAALLIAEQHPLKLENLLTTVAPFAILKVRKLGGIARLKKLRLPRSLDDLKPLGRPIPFTRRIRHGKYFAPPVQHVFDPKLTEKARGVRAEKAGLRETDFITKNVAVAKITIRPRGKVGGGEPDYLDSINIPGKMVHSEDNLLEHIRKMNMEMGKQNKEVVLEQLYSERMPCGHCQGMLDNLASEAGIFYTVPQVRDDMTKAEALMRAYGLGFSQP